MDGGSRTSRDLTETWRSRRHRPVRVGLSACLIALLAAYLVGSGSQPTHEVLAAAATGPSGGTGGEPPSTAPPVRLPQPTGQQLHHAASVSGPPVQSMSAGAAGIPAVAMSAYQRSAVVMDAANPSCRI